MEMRRVPGTEIDISAICLGTMTYGNPVDGDRAICLTHLALDLGINFIDTANIYEGYDRVVGSAGGVSEQFLGEALKGRRDQAVVTTKAGCFVGAGDDNGGLSPRHIMRELERSLKRLQTDYVDFYLAHIPDPKTPTEAIVPTFDEIVRSGKARAWGFSNFEAPDIARMVETAKTGGYAPPRLSQPYYSMLGRDAEKEHIPTCLEHDIGITCYRVLESGLLTGKYAKGAPPPKDARGDVMPSWLSFDQDDDTPFEIAARVAEIAGEHGMTPVECALAWTIAQQGITAAVVGVKNEEQLRQAARAGERTLERSVLDEIDAIL
jgi:aryl-alcohol dehydrogenase-like predicted oxidoreductase